MSERKCIQNIQNGDTRGLEGQISKKLRKSREGEQRRKEDAVREEGSEKVRRQSKRQKAQKRSEENIAARGFAQRSERGKRKGEERERKR